MRYVFLLIILVLCSSPTIVESNEGSGPALCAESDVVIDVAVTPEVVHSGSARATFAAFMPGMLVHGSGHFAAGDRKTGNRLLLWSGIGAGLATVGGGALLWTRGNRRVSGFGMPLLVSGIGIFGASWLADIYGSATGGVSRERGKPTRASVALGHTYVQDPQFSYKHFANLQMAIHLGRLDVLPSMWAAVGADNHRGRLALGYSLWRNEAGTRLSVEVAGTNHRFGDDGFTTRVVEATVAGHWNLAGLGPRLSGAFVDLSAGLAHQTIHIDMPGIASTKSPELLARVAFGLYLPAQGRAEFYYNHRRDGLAGGLTPGRRGSGFAGHIGLGLVQPFGKRLAARVLVELGSAWVVTTALEARWGQGE